MGQRPDPARQRRDHLNPASARITIDHGAPRTLPSLAAMTRPRLITQISKADQVHAQQHARHAAARDQLTGQQRETDPARKYARLNNSKAWGVDPAGASLAANPLITE